MPPGDHGAVIRSQPLANSAALPSAARNLLVLYHSRSIDGRDIAVSGAIAIPKEQTAGRRLAGDDLGAWHHRHRRRLRAVEEYAARAGARVPEPEANDDG